MPLEYLGFRPEPRIGLSIQRRGGVGFNLVKQALLKVRNDERADAGMTATERKMSAMLGRFANISKFPHFHPDCKTNL